MSRSYSDLQAALDQSPPPRQYHRPADLSVHELTKIMEFMAMARSLGFNGSAQESRIMSDWADEIWENLSDIASVYQYPSRASIEDSIIAKAARIQRALLLEEDLADIKARVKVTHDICDTYQKRCRYDILSRVETREQRTAEASVKRASQMLERYQEYEAELRAPYRDYDTARLEKALVNAERQIKHAGLAIMISDRKGRCLDEKSNENSRKAQERTVVPWKGKSKLNEEASDTTEDDSYLIAEKGKYGRPTMGPNFIVERGNYGRPTIIHGQWGNKTKFKKHPKAKWSEIKKSRVSNGKVSKI